jgi:hypothetical protein
LIFDYRQDTKQADHAGQKPLFGVNYRFYSTDIWVKKVSSLLFLALTLLMSLGLIPRSFGSLFLATDSQIKKEY